MTEIHSKKLRRFAASVNYEIEEKREQIQQQAEIEKEELLKKTEERVLQESYVRIQKAVKDIENKYRRAEAFQEQELHVEVLKHRNVLIKMIFMFVEQKISQLVQSEEYEKFLIGQTENEDLNGAVIKVCERDMVYAQAIEKASGCKVEVDEDISLGGILICYNEKGIVNNKSFDNAFEEQQQTFSSKFSFNDD